VRLPNGNTLVNFGSNANARNGMTVAEYGLQGGSSARPVLAVEARPDGSIAWEYWLQWAMQTTTTRYRSYPMESIMGEHPVLPTLPGPATDR
jgi:hypothetical protein